MNRLTPDWDEICELLEISLTDISSGMRSSLENGESPDFTATSALEELKALIFAIEKDINVG